MADKRKANHFTVTKVEPLEFDRNMKLTKQNIAQVLLNIKESDISYSFIMNVLADFAGECLCHPYDTIDVPKGAYKFTNEKGKEVSNKNSFVTTIGLLIFNIYFLRDDGLAFLFDGYINSTVNKKLFKNMNQTLSYALLEDKITLDQHKKFLEKTQWIMTFEGVMCPNHTEKILSCTKVLNKKKAELYKKYKDEVEKGNPDAMDKMRNELLAYAKEYLGDDPALDSYMSGGGGSFDNNFGNVYCMRGAFADPDPNAKKKYNMIMSNFSDGVSAEEYHMMANTLANGAYSRGKKTAEGGYNEKLFVSALSYITLGPEDSDCGTTHYITPTLTNDNIAEYMYNFIIEGSKLVELTSENRDKYIGKKVKMRFSSMCKRLDGKGCLCNHCAGNLFYRLGIKNIGVAESRMPSIQKNKAMKAFHDGTLTMCEIDPMKAFSLVDY